MIVVNLNTQISIIICTFSKADLLRNTLLSLEKLLDIDQAEVIVVDNNSLDETAEVVLECMHKLKGVVNIRYVFESRQGLSVARNTGVDAARAPIIAFLDDDALPYISWLPNIRNAFKRYPDAAAIGGPIHPDFETTRPEWLIKQLEMSFTIVNLGNHEREYSRTNYPLGANMAIRSEALRNVRFPETPKFQWSSLLFKEEAWLFKLLRKKRMKLYYIPGMRVRHYIPEDRLQREWIKRRYYDQGVLLAGRSKHLLFRLHILLKLGLKFLFTAVHSRLAHTSGQWLLNECRKESIRGSIDALRRHSVEVGAME
jgi:glycosyltransferase involved in cell wall biosynthesis